MGALVPVDGSSFLMEALRFKRAELFLENIIPFGDPVPKKYDSSILYTQ